MTTTLTALLCIGLILGPKTPAKAGTLPKPRLWAEPGSVIPLGEAVTFWCEETPGAHEYVLYKEGSRSIWRRQTSMQLKDVAKFSILSVKQHHAGQYRCYYQAPSGQSEHSDSLELLVTGFYSKPSLSALRSPVVDSGGNVTLQCQAQLVFDQFILTKEGGDKLSWTLDSQQYPSGQAYALFPVGPVTPRQRWTFRCYGSYNIEPNMLSEPSDALELLVSGEQGPYYRGFLEESFGQDVHRVGNLNMTHRAAQEGQGVAGSSPSVWVLLPLVLSRKYSLLTQKGPVWQPGHNLTLRILTPQGISSSCQATAAQEENLCERKMDATVNNTKPEDRVELSIEAATCEGPQDVTYAQLSNWTLNQGTTVFPTSRVRAHLEEPTVYTVLASSRPRAISKERFYRKPSILALPSPVVTSGANVTLQCTTGQQCERFMLTKEGEAKLSWNLESRCLPNGQFQALFPVGPVTLGPRWSFRYYSYDKERPGCGPDPVTPWSSWSQSPVVLLICPDLCELFVPIPALQPQDYTVGNLIRMGLAGLVLVALEILLLQAHCSQRRI
nr:leukocyte immunoglobulin-like receptor subfamily A member 6 [Cavia porcellus]